MYVNVPDITEGIYSIPPIVFPIADKIFAFLIDENGR